MSLKRRLLPAALLVSLTVPFVALGTLPAQAADDQITAYAAEASLTGDGVLKVKETVDLAAGGDSFARTLATRVRSDADEDRTYDLKNVSATVNGQPARELRGRGHRERPPAQSQGGRPGKIVYTYEVGNVVADSTEGREVSWPIVQGYPVGIPKASVSLNVPFATWVTCIAGRVGSSMPCTTSQLAETPRSRSSS